MAGPADPHPHIIVAPGPEGAAVSWQYRCEQCGAQELADAREQAHQLAERHNADAHGGAGEVSLTSIGAV
jgi:hypothetical protein